MGLISVDSAKVATLRQWIKRRRLNVEDNDTLVAVWNKGKELWPQMGELRFKVLVDAALRMPGLKKGEK